MSWKNSDLFFLTTDILCFFRENKIMKTVKTLFSFLVSSKFLSLAGTAISFPADDSTAVVVMVPDLGRLYVVLHLLDDKNHDEFQEQLPLFRIFHSMQRVKKARCLKTPVEMSSTAGKLAYRCKVLLLAGTN